MSACDPLALSDWNGARKVPNISRGFAEELRRGWRVRLPLDYTNGSISLVQQKDVPCRGHVESQVRASCGRLALRAVPFLDDVKGRARRRAGGGHEEHTPDRILAAFR